MLNYCSLNNEEIFLNNFDINKINFDKFESAFCNRIRNKPISKIFNKKEFWSLSFYVNDNVLDPRPESEFLIEAIKFYFTNLKTNIKICDLGTGSGCLAITLAKIYKNSQIVATDISKDAIRIAKKNAKDHSVENQIKFINCNWILKKDKYDFIVSNPPYLSYSQYEKCKTSVKNFEPKIALLGGPDGLKSYREILAIANSILYKDSLLFIEIGKNQKNNILDILKYRKLKIIKIIKDYQLIDRILVIKKE